MKKVVLGGHWGNNPGWDIFTEAQQDITKPLQFEDNSIDCLFTCHVIEHVDFVPAIDFFKEAYRVVKPGGVIRTVCPTMDTFVQAPLSDSNGLKYVESSLLPWFQAEHKKLEEIGLPGILTHSEAFLIASMFHHHGHRFLWSNRLLTQVLKAVGFSQVYSCKVGQGINPDYCIERRARGIYTGSDWQENLKYEIFDPESGVVEAIK